MEHRLAAQWSGYTWVEYLVLPGDPQWMTLELPDCKAYVLVAYRNSRLMDDIERSVSWD